MKKANENLERAQGFDTKSEKCVFGPGDKVLPLLPVVSFPFQPWFSGPYSVIQQVSDQDYTILTPDRKRKSKLCYINFLMSLYACHRFCR